MDLIRIGTFELYPSERMLRAAGKPVDVGARAFDLLLVLAEHQGRLVTKTVLLDRVWPRLVVDENNLPAQIASLRRVLGAGAIRTIPGFGYRLELPVSNGKAGEQAPESVASPREREPPQLLVPRRAWPNRLGSLVGRSGDLAELQKALGQSCLVTLVGIAGVGKTRIAQEILAREADKPGNGVAWVSLQPLNEAQHIPSAIAHALGLALPEGPDGFAALRQALERTPVLLILDGAEQFVATLAIHLTELVSRTQGVRALVTSQVPLGVPGETVYRLPPLPVPERGMTQTDAARFAAVELFAERARRFSARVRDVSQQLETREIRNASCTTGQSVTYDASCHLLYGQHAGEAPLKLVNAVSSLELARLEGSERCCGGAGIYNLLEPDLSARVLDEKLAAIQKTGAKILATGNPGCQMQIGAGALLAGMDLKTCHPVELLDEAVDLPSFHHPLRVRPLSCAGDQRRKNRHGVVRTYEAFGAIAQPANVSRLLCCAFRIGEGIRRINRLDARRSAFQHEAASRVVEFHSLAATLGH